LYACPAHCPHNPFAPANYAQLLQIEDRVAEMSLDRLFKDSSNRSAIEKRVQEARADRSPHAINARMVWELHFQPDAEGQSVMQAWESAGLAGTRNDERVVIRARNQIRVALVEVRRILDLETIEVIDLMAPDRPPILLHDRNLASSAQRFVAFLGWFYPMPHYWRSFGTAIIIPGLETLEPLDVVTRDRSTSGGSHRRDQNATLAGRAFCEVRSRPPGGHRDVASEHACWHRCQARSGRV
jgi:hypothetical protein